MQLFRSLDNDIRDFRHHINTDGTAVAIFNQLIPHTCGNIPKHHTAVPLFDFIQDSIRTGRYIQAFGNIIFIFSTGKFLQDIRNRPVPINQKKLSGRKKLPVNPVRQIRIAGGKHHLSQKRHKQLQRRYQAAVDHRHLQIRKNIGAQQSEYLGSKNLHGLEIPHLQSSVGPGKKEQDHQVKEQD